MNPLQSSQEAGTLLSNPSMVIVSVGAVAGLIAAARWMKVSHSVDTSGEVVTGPSKWVLKDAAMWTAIALFVVCGGFLLGRLTREF